MFQNFFATKTDLRQKSAINTVFEYRGVDIIFDSELKLCAPDGKIDFCQIILSYLKKTNRLDDIVNRVTSAKSNVERIDIVYSLVETEMQQMPSNFQLDEKSNEMSEKFRKEGNDFFAKKMFTEAYDKFSESIRFAVNDSEQLGFAFANRSAVLYEMKFYKECIKDIDYALSYNYPEETKQKHMKRKENAMKKQKNQIECTEPYYESLPEITALESKKPVSDSRKKVRLSFDKNNYLRLVATKDIKVGDIIFIEKAHAQCLLPTFKNRHCSYCTNLCYNLIPCKSCVHEMYCSEKCREEAEQQYHKYECRLLGIAFNLKLAEKHIEVLRTILIARDDYKDDNIEDLQNPAGDVPTDPIHSVHFKRILNNVKLATPIPEGLFRISLETAMIYYLLKHHSSFFEEFSPDCKMEDKFKQFALTLLHILLFNNVTIKKYTLNSDIASVSCGVFPMLLMLKHACSTNVIVEFRGCFAVARASLPIKAGEECNICKAYNGFGPLNHLNLPKSTRAHLLKETFQLDCNCAACKEDWEIFDFLPYVEEFHNVVETYVRTMEKMPHRRAARRFIPMLIEFITEIKGCYYRTNRELEMAKYGLNLCFAVLGNKDISDL